MLAVESKCKQNSTIVVLSTEVLKQPRENVLNTHVVVSISESTTDIYAVSKREQLTLQSVPECEARMKIQPLTSSC